MSDASPPPRRSDYSWMDAIEDVLDASIEEEEDIEAVFEEFEVDVPLQYGEDAPFGRWKLNGTVRVSVDGMRGGLAEWLRYWSERREMPRRTESGTGNGTDE